MPEVNEEIAMDLAEGEDGWSHAGWKFMGHTAHYQKPVAPMVYPRTHNGKAGGKRRYEPAVAFPWGGMRFADVLFKRKDQAEFVAQMMYNQALMHYEMEQLLHRLDRLQIKQDDFERNLRLKAMEG